MANNIVKMLAVGVAASIAIGVAISRRQESADPIAISEPQDAPIKKTGEVLDSPDDDLTLGELEAMIREVEQVTVNFVIRESGRNARDDRRGFTAYPFTTKLSDEFTVAELTRSRLSQYIAYGLKPIVKNSYNHAIHGGTRLRVVRSTFFPELP